MSALSKPTPSARFAIAAPKPPAPVATRLAYLKNGDSFFSIRAKVVSISGIKEFTNMSGAGCLLGFTLLDSTCKFASIFQVNIDHS
jgi:hypothetical protein